MQKAEQVCSAFCESVRCLQCVRLAFLTVRSSHLTRALFAIRDPEQNGSCNKDRTVGTDQNADQKSKREGVNAFATEDVKQQYRYQSRSRGEQGSAQRLVYAVVDHVTTELRTSSANFTNAVEHNDRVIQGVTDDREEGSNLSQTDLKVFDEQES